MVNLIGMSLCVRNVVTLYIVSLRHPLAYIVTMCNPTSFSLLIYTAVVRVHAQYWTSVHVLPWTTLMSEEQKIPGSTELEWSPGELGIQLCAKVHLFLMITKFMFCKWKTLGDSWTNAPMAGVVPTAPRVHAVQCFLVVLGGTWGSNSTVYNLFFLSCGELSWPAGHFWELERWKSHLGAIHYRSDLAASILSFPLGNRGAQPTLMFPPLLPEMDVTYLPITSLNSIPLPIWSGLLYANYP